MNLYIKNLEPHITNQDLSQTFRKFGRIISARVMTNPATGLSKGYGFVSFGKSEEAAAALQEMHGVMLGNRPLIVAYHEPRKGRPNTMMPNNNNHRNGMDSNHNNNNSHYHQHHHQDYNNNSYQQQPPYYTSDHTQQRSMNNSKFILYMRYFLYLILI
jgi:RNA recognition motif-containing protein